MSGQDTIIGVDIGGTNLRLGVVRAGQVLGFQHLAVGSPRTPATFVARLAERIATTAAPFGSPTAIGIGAPGIVDAATGVILKAPHYPDWVGVSLATALREYVACPVVVENDANAIAWGEAQFGAGRALANFVMLTFGTGIGGGLILNRQLFRGDHGFAGEVGHQVIALTGPACPCGGQGHWELYASASGIARVIDDLEHASKGAFLARFQDDAKRVTPADLFSGARAGDGFALAVWQRIGAVMGAGIASLTNILGIEHFVIGGGMAAAWEYFIADLQRAVAERTYPELAARLRCHRALLGEQAGILGAAALAQVAR